jgi:hypothetical protein
MAQLALPSRCLQPASFHRGLPATTLTHHLTTSCFHAPRADKRRAGAEAGKLGGVPGRWEDVHAHFKFGSCALVGNSGALRASTLGPAIDTHHAVLRLNQVCEPSSGGNTRPTP